MIRALEKNQPMLRSGLLGIVAFAFLQGSAFAQMHGQHASEAACDEPTLRCATKATPAFGPDGKLWLAWMAGGQVSVASSQDAGRSFSAPVQVTTTRLNLDWGPDARPKIVVDRKGGIPWHSRSSGMRRSTAKCSTRAPAMAGRALPS